VKDDPQLTTEQDWLDAIKHAEDTGETGPLVRMLRSDATMSPEVMDALADLFENFELAENPWLSQ
jgi:hypothetical protein